MRAIPPIIPGGLQQRIGGTPMKMTNAQTSPPAASSPAVAHCGAYGAPPIQYLIRTRLERAAQLLQYKHLQIKQIAQETGFPDQLYFSRKFNSHFNCSPRTFLECL